ncbi:hypothetical protein BDQ17DRAFT_1332644 [Cyathus striatus]|nr:hypothetical protein BDQ17DRAFT_1332644 [Cyathus striatus]
MNFKGHHVQWEGSHVDMQQETHIIMEMMKRSDAPKANFVISNQEPLCDLKALLEHVEKNARISLRENDNWSLKGRYLSIQEKKTSTITWQINDKNKYVLEILALILIRRVLILNKELNNSKDQDIRITYEKYEMIEDIWNNKKPSLSTIMTSAKTNIDKKAAAEEEKKRKSKGKGKEREESEEHEEEEERVESEEREEREEKGGKGSKEKSKKSHRKDKGKSKKFICLVSCISTFNK